MILSRTERKIQGQFAEDRFRRWLDRCCLPHIYVEQSPFTIPEPLRGEIKRQDFLVGIRDALIIDAYEHRTLLNFETFFNTSVWFACFPPGEPHTCHLFLNRNLAGLERSNLKGEAVIAVPLKITRPADERRDFMAALMGAISLR
jgi:hypothetical protein